MISRHVRIRCRLTVLGALGAALLLALGIPQAGAAQEPRLPIDYTLAEAGNVSLAVYDATGRMVRPILYGQPHAAGKHTLSWDGLDRYGDSLPAGRYEWRLLRTPGFSREFLVNLGVSTSWSPYDHWPGNHVGPTQVLVDDDDVLYVGSRSSESPPSLLKMALDGSRKYWDTGSWGLGDGLVGLARIGPVVFLQMGTVLDGRRADNGQKFWGVPKLRRLSEQNVPFADLLHAGDDRKQKKISPMSMAGGKDFLAVTYRNYNEVRCLWPVDDQIDREKSVTVPQPGAVTVLPEGIIFVVSGSDLVQIDHASGQVTTIVRDVPQPGKIAYDPVFKDLLVVSGGKCVRRYHVPDGQPIAVYGRPAGRSYGLFNPLDFDDIVDLAADRHGGFVTVEQFPRRVAHFRGRETHELVNQWIGGLQWGSQASIDPADRTLVYVPIDHRHLGRAKIDYTAKSWTLTHLYDTVDHGSWSLGSIRHRDILPIAGERNFWEVRHVGEHTFLVNRGGGVAGGSVTVLRVDDQENRLWPVAHLGSLHPSLDRQKLPNWWVAALGRIGIKAAKTFEAAGGYKHFSFSWSDKNQNGLVDTAEIRLASIGVRMGDYNCYVAPNWDIVCPLRLETNGDLWSVIPNEGTLEVPVWNWDHGRPGEARYPARELAEVRPSPTSIYRDRDGATYLTVNNSQQTQDAVDTPPLYWPNNKNHSSRFLKWDAEGRQVFSVGLHTGAKFDAAYLFGDVRAILGEARDCLVVMDACIPASVWTRDGLFAGGFLDDVGISAKLEGWQALAFKKGPPLDDNQWGQVIETQEGDVLWGSMHVNSTPFFRITGWDRWERQHGSLTVETASLPARRNGTGLMGEYFASPDLTGKPILSQVNPEIWFGPLRGGARSVKARTNWFTGNGGGKLSQEMLVSARWTGSVEAPLSEDFTFVVYTYGQAGRFGKKTIGGRVRLWIAEKLVIDSWEESTFERFKSEWNFSREVSSPPIPLQAGRQVPIKIEYAFPGGADAHLHLYWSSRSFDLRHIPRSYFYPAEVAASSPLKKTPLKKGPLKRKGNGSK